MMPSTPHGPAATGIVRLQRLRLYFILILAGWTCSFAGAFFWQSGHLRDMTLDLAHKEAEANFNKDQAFRFWATLHGGVYVPASEQTPPNPYLSNMPERDLVTPSGRQLTLMNPAYMLRQLNQEFGELLGVRGHITSLDPLRPDNAPDPWEASALRAFEAGAEEVLEVSTIDGRPYLRFMAPMKTEQGCLVCHAHQGYQIGDVRGGVSVAVPLQDYLTHERHGMLRTLGSLTAVWVLGLSGLAVGYRRLRADALYQFQASREIEVLNTDLERRIRDRTADLVVARDAAEAANRAKSVFLANMSHELRTPLNAIIGFSRLAERDPGLAPKTREGLHLIQRNGQHLLSLINDVLDMAKVESGRMQLDEEALDLPMLLRDAVDTMRQQAESKGLTLRLDVAGQLPRGIRADGRKLRQILFNLMSNAIKFSEHGEVRLFVEPRGDRLHLELSDQGRGMSARELAQVFEPFYQAGMAANGQGTGLGMPITRQFVLLMGGEIALHSEPGRGTRVVLDLPLQRVDLTDQATTRARRVIALAAGQAAYRVLVVDDAEANRRLLVCLMEMVGFQVREAANGAEALDLWREWRPHFIWMDLRMPVMDGYEACRAIRSEPGGGETVIVALTASSTVDDRQKILEHGFNDMLRKPFEENDLFAVMGRRLGLRYEYAEGEVAPPVDTSHALDMKGLPDALRTSLRDALVTGDVDMIENLLRRVAELDVELARHLNERVAVFDFAAILNALDGRGDAS